MKAGILFLLVVQYSNCQDYSQCGRTKMKTTDSQGNIAVNGEFPNMCTLYLRYEGFNIFIGAASLIGPNQVLTLASGVSKFRGEGGSCGDATAKFDLSVNCGSVDLQPDQEDLKAQTRKVKSILIHPEFDPKSLINDMAVLVMDSAFEMTEYVGPACLPEPSFNPKNFLCVATGHGKDTYGEYGYYSKELKRSSQLRIWNREDCESTLNSEYFQTNHSLNWEADSSFICAGGDEDVDTCEGDGGGPLVCLVSGDYDAFVDASENNGDEEYFDIFDSNYGDTSSSSSSSDDFDIFGDTTYDNDLDLRENALDLRGASEDEPAKLFQVGIVAWGIECGRKGIPSVYSNLMDGRCWLDQIMSCYKLQDDDLDLRGSDDEAPISVGGLTESQCGSWLQSSASDAAACGCKQKLAENEIQDDTLDLRDDGTLGLREAK